MLQRLVEEALSQGLFLGAAYRVFHRNGSILAEGLPGRSQENPDVPVAADTVWDLASITKPLATATSILILAQEGQLHLGEEVASFLPADAAPLEGITLRHLLTHTSGLPPWVQYHSRHWDRAEILRRVRTAARMRPIGAGYAYSDLGYILLGEVVGAVSGQDVATFARERIFEPLGMRDTRYLPPEEWRGRIAATRCPDRGRILIGEVHDGNCAAMGGIAGHAGLFGTREDLQTYGTMILNEGEKNGTRVLCPLAVRQMGKNQNPPGLNGHTLGWFTRPSTFLPLADFLPEDAFGHTGFTGTSLVLCPSLEVGIVLLTNRVYAERDPADFLRWRRRFHNAAAALLT